MSDQPKITVVLLNYRRPKNIPTILDTIKNQTIEARIFLWNNGAEDVNSPLIDLYERSEKNVGCMARWHQARKATTPYVMSLDDDICLGRNDALEKVVGALERQDNANRIVGFIGATFGFLPRYDMRREFTCRYGDTSRRTQVHPDTCHLNRSGGVTCVERQLVTEDAQVDMVKGRAMAFNRKLLDNVSLPAEREDDVFLSALFANRSRKFHRIPTLLHDVFYELPDFGSGNWLEPAHQASRNRAVRAYFSPGPVADNWVTRSLAAPGHVLKFLYLKALPRLERN